uniref:Otoconin 90 n=1 Tax=Podarcis muralis TaxID=64176 RepID=A0A670JNN3_PODMU|nr:otoconin-90 isoform X1 [Podarcis muralis]XP_028591969.1 otoconin-90 isoform X1 [Podarcis muralis]
MMVILLVNMLMVLHSGGGQGSETPAIPMDLPHAAERDLNNITFFNGVFANVEGVALFFDCLGSQFTWLQSIFTSFPALLNFVSKMRCVTGICPRDFEDYGCTCRFEMEGLPADEFDGCCFEHRKCYEEATEEECVWDPAKISTDVSCLTKNTTCESDDACERLLCNCDKAAIECFLHSHINSSLNSMDVSLCPSLVTETVSERSQTTLHAAEFQNQRAEDTQLKDTSVAEVIPQTTDGMVVLSSGADLASDATSDGGLEAHREGDISPESSGLLLRNPEEGVNPDMESGGGLETLRDGAQEGLAGPFGNSMPRGLSVKAFNTEETSAAPPAVISSTEPESVSTSDSLGRSTDNGNHFKIAEEEGRTFSTISPEETPDPDETFGEVCDRFTFLQLRDNGRVKRVLPQLGEMLYCLTDRCPEDFELYGCYCGQEGRGHPTDELDRCCFSHHCCLEQVKKLGCRPERNSRSEVVCFDRTPKCIGWTMCEKLQCSCDKAAAECMAAASFNESMGSPNRQACPEPEVKLFCRRGGHERPLSGAGISSRASSEEERSSEETDLARSLLGRRKRSARLARGISRAVRLQRR